MTLGLGVNQLLLFVVLWPTSTTTVGGDDDDERRVVHNVYTLTVYRQPRRIVPPPPHSTGPDAEPAPSPSSPSEACTLLQVYALMFCKIHSVTKSQ